MKKLFDVIVAGELNVDIIMNGIDQVPVIGKEILAENMTITLGSSSAIFASNLSTLGTKVTFAGMVGADKFGELVLDVLKEKGVDINNIKVSSEYTTGATIVLSFDQDRANVTYAGAMTQFGIDDIRDETLKRARHLHISSVFLQDKLRRDIPTLLKKAKRFGLTTSIDPQWDPSENWDFISDDIMSNIDVFMPNAEECRALTKTRTLQDAIEAVKKFSAISVIKCGGDGAYLWDGRSLIHCPAFFNNKVVDTIGAGDSFDAGFIHAYLQKKAWLECLQFGAAAGALNTTHAGGTNAFQTRDQIKLQMEQMFNYKF
ncbi:MAG: carbohydrate kinase family protein [Chryseolinea sp.]